MRVSVQLRCPPAAAAGARYGLGVLLDLVGVGSSFDASEAQANAIRLVYAPGPPRGASWDVWIPCEDPLDVDGARITAVDGTPVVHRGRPADALAHHSDGRTAFRVDLGAAVVFLLSRREEMAPAHRDEMDKFVERRSLLLSAGFGDVPILNVYAELLDDALQRAAERRRLCTVQKCRWPWGRRWAACLTHDVDQLGWFSLADGARGLLRWLLKRPHRGLRYSLFLMREALRQSGTGERYRSWRLDDWLALEEDAGVRSTFFFMTDQRGYPFTGTYDVREPSLTRQLRSMAARGWEIGLHAGFDTYRSTRELRGEKAHLERALGQPVRGVRQHFLRFAAPDTWRAQAAAGFEYDATLGWWTQAGFRAGAACPFRPFDLETQSVLPIIELPLTAMDGALFYCLRYGVDQAVDRVSRLLDAAREHAGLAVLLWHQRVRDEAQYPGWWQTYQAALDRLARAPDVFVAPAGDVAAWWRGREGVQLTESASGGDLAQWRVECREPLPAGLALRIRRSRGVECSAPHTLTPDGEDVLLTLTCPFAAGQTVRLSASALPRRGRTQ